MDQAIGEVGTKKAIICLLCGIFDFESKIQNHEKFPRVSILTRGITAGSRPTNSQSE